MPQSSMLYVGFDVHKESIAVAAVAQDYGEVRRLKAMWRRRPSAIPVRETWHASMTPSREEVAPLPHSVHERCLRQVQRDGQRRRTGLHTAPSLRYGQSWRDWA